MSPSLVISSLVRSVCLLLLPYATEFVHVTTVSLMPANDIKANYTGNMGLELLTLVLISESNV